MNISELVEILNGYLGWHKSRITCFSKMLLSLISTRTVNLNKIACTLMSEAQQSSRYRQLQRFFSGFEMNYDKIAGLLFRLFFVESGQWYLTMDRTNWRWGKKDINILTLAIAFKGAAIPIYWMLLDKKGNSDTPERIELVQKFVNRFGKSCIAGLLCDREFVGKVWFKWLLQENISFYIRIKKNTVTTNAQGQPIDIDALFYGLSVNEQRVMKGKRNVWGHSLYLAGLRLADGDLLIIATDKSPEDAITIYGKRWEIETLFGCLKGRGFHFEDTHITSPEKIKKVMVLLAVAFAWAHKTGEWQNTVKPIKVKTHGRPSVSIFRYGLDLLVQLIANLQFRTKTFKKCLDFLKISPIQDDLEEAL